MLPDNTEPVPTVNVETTSALPPQLPKKRSHKWLVIPIICIGLILVGVLVFAATKQLQPQPQPALGNTIPTTLPTPTLIPGTYVNQLNISLTYPDSFIPNPAESEPTTPMPWSYLAGPVAKIAFSLVQESDPNNYIHVYKNTADNQLCKYFRLPNNTLATETNTVTLGSIPFMSTKYQNETIYHQYQSGGCYELITSSTNEASEQLIQNTLNTIKID